MCSLAQKTDGDKKRNTATNNMMQLPTERHRVKVQITPSSLKWETSWMKASLGLRPVLGIEMADVHSPLKSIDSTLFAFDKGTHFLK